MSRTRFSLLTAATLLLFAGCSADPAPSDAPSETANAAAPAGPDLATATAVGLQNAVAPVDGIVSSAQPTPEQMDALAAAGFQHFICPFDDVWLLLMHPRTDTVPDERDWRAALPRKRISGVLVDVAGASTDPTALDCREIDSAPHLIGAHLIIAWFAQDHGT